jgi:hypothetical protein
VDAVESIEPSRADKARLVELVKAYCSHPVGLTDDEGGALVTWDEIAGCNPIYAREALYKAAEAIFEHVRGGTAEMAVKNSNSSLP